MLDDGIYALDYRIADREPDAGTVGSALALLRDGRIFGSDEWGGLFDGCCACEGAGESLVRIRLQVPPDGELLTGFAAGPLGATVEIAAAIARAAPRTRSRSRVEVEGTPVEVELRYIGPLPI